jgi:hypothetical protein
MSNAQVRAQFAHIGGKLFVGDHVDHAAVLHYVVPIGDCIGLDLIGRVSDLGVRLRASDRSDQQATARGWFC